MTEKISISTERKRRSEQSQCEVCGSPAFYSYFSIIACEACKVFFRRHAPFGQNALKCLHNGQCDVNMHTRHICTSCRLAKCLEKGMKPEMIRRSIINKTNTLKSTALIKSNQIGKFPTLNLLDKDNSLLNCDQWTLLSNLIHNYQESKLLSICEKIQSENDSLGMINSTTLQDSVMYFYETAGNSLRFNVDLAQLPIDDRSILLQSAANNVTCIGGQSIYYHSQLINCDRCWEDLNGIYGKIPVEYKRWSTKFADPNFIICKLSIPLFALLTNTRILGGFNIEGEYENFKQILTIQDKYVELLWKYLLYQYGYKDSIRRYNRIIQWFLALTVFMQYAHNADAHVNDVQTLVEQTELAFVLDDVEKLVHDTI